MKITQIKVVISIAILGTLVFFLWKSCSSVTASGPDTADSTKSGYVDSCIMSIDRLADDDICSQLYMNCKKAIVDWSSAASEAEKKRWQVELNGKYAIKICDQATDYFNSGSCDLNKLSCLSARINDLKSSGELDPDEQLYQKLEQISGQIQLIEAVDALIATGNKFNYLGSGEITDTFPITTVTQILSTIDSFEKMSIISRCQRLTLSINSLRTNLFQKHIAFLEKKINAHGGKYKEMENIDYKNNIIRPLTNEVQDLDNSIYKVDSNVFGQKQGDLSSIFSNYQLSAYRYYSKSQKVPFK
jgi:hypothetical protein